MTYAYEALDRTHCIINTIQINLVEHPFYDANEDYRKLVDSSVESLCEAYQVAGKFWYEEIDEDSSEIGDLKAKNLQLEDRLVKANKVVDKVNQMGFWKRLVYLFKGKKVFK